MKRLLGVLLSLILVLSLSVIFAPQAQAAELHVGAGQTYSTIQDAIDNAEDGDTIIVHPGTYNECVDVPSGLDDLTIQSTGGAGVTTIDGSGGSDNVVYIQGDNITLEGFTITGADDSYSGVLIDYSDAPADMHATIADNTITGNGGCGIYATASRNAYLTITGNTITGNGDDGVYVYTGDGEAEGVISDNTVSDNDGDGIYIYSSDNQIGIDITGNTIENNEYGIYMDTNEDHGVVSSILDNRVAGNDYDGIHIRAGEDSEVVGQGDMVVTMTGNTIVNNGGSGAYFWPRYDNVYIADNTINHNTGGLFCGLFFDIDQESNEVLAHSGSHVWYSGAGDFTNKRLTRTFDLSSVSEATLSFWTWYALESGCDYGYVEINDGGGWDELFEFNGNSEGWEHCTVDISEYTGGSAQIRFRQETDECCGWRGWYVDDIAISAIGFADNVESGTNGWQASPWGWGITQLYGSGITNNVISGNNTGVYILNMYEAHQISVSPCNNIFDNTEYGIYNDSGLLINATSNWWGDATGPYDGSGDNEVPPCTDNPWTEINANGLGDAVSEGVDYCPWLTTPCTGQPVGGELFPVNKLGVLAPWLALALLLALGGGLVMRRRLAR
jgi:parallel beta-helix repeat protein